MAEAIYGDPKVDQEVIEKFKEELNTVVSGTEFRNLSKKSLLVLRQLMRDYENSHINRWIEVRQKQGGRAPDAKQQQLFEEQQRISAEDNTAKTEFTVDFPALQHKLRQAMTQRIKDHGKNMGYRDVARESGVSVATIFRVFNNQDDIDLRLDTALKLAMWSKSDIYDIIKINTKDVND